jgi:Domain of unknown function (DUF4783)
MKTLILILSLVAPMSFQNPNISVITKALSEGDATTIGNYFDASVEMTLAGTQNVYDKAQATAALKDFFNKNKPRAYSAVHQGTSKGSTSHYTIGDLTTGSGNYRVYMYYKSSGGSFAIQEIRIEK